jgi:hypothetical protein
LGNYTNGHCDSFDFVENYYMLHIIPYNKIWCDLNIL